MYLCWSHCLTLTIGGLLEVRITDIGCVLETPRRHQRRRQGVQTKNDEFENSIEEVLWGIC